MRQPVELETADEAATEALAARLVAALPPLEENPAVVWLAGGLGSGKTTFARGALRALGVRGTVRSPTYTLLERYELDALTVVHLDLYRLRDAGELEPLGLRELHKPLHLWFIEWPERGGARLPPPDLRVELQAGAHAHRLLVGAQGALGIGWLERAQLAP